ncbi:MAG: CRISPR system precrRNA processing endoribonuclease RAMP protein Cas6 [Acidobacteriaceae bacterium]|nr:CRISPR system precrRNA processing endoribonuclease RAMP protein Cas6 [Acidobacteriaceae bacterium]
MDFVVLPARLEFVAQDSLRLPPGKELNIFRGALGAALRRISCVPRCTWEDNRTHSRECVYARFFEPRWEEGPSGYRDAPRPFVLRWASGHGDVAPGEAFAADIFVFDTLESPWSALEEAFTLAGASGFGQTKGRAKLINFEPARSGGLRLPVVGAPGYGSLRLSFVTPTELKSAGEVLIEPAFPVTIHRLAERVRALGRLYQGWPDEWNYTDLLAAAQDVKLTRWEWVRTDVFRRSASNGQQHSIGGFTGWAEYTGPIGAFLPLLEIGRWVGVGRQTVWGKGEIRIERVELQPSNTSCVAIP